jgi:hypothetical protein
VSPPPHPPLPHPPTHTPQALTDYARFCLRDGDRARAEACLREALAEDTSAAAGGAAAGQYQPALHLLVGLLLEAAQPGGPSTGGAAVEQAEALAFALKEADASSAAAWALLGAAYRLQGEEGGCAGVRHGQSSSLLVACLGLGVKGGWLPEHTIPYSPSHVLLTWLQPSGSAHMRSTPNTVLAQHKKGRRIARRQKGRPHAPTDMSDYQVSYLCFRTCICLCICVFVSTSLFVSAPGAGKPKEAAARSCHQEVLRLAKAATAAARPTSSNGGAAAAAEGGAAADAEPAAAQELPAAANGYLAAAQGAVEAQLVGLARSLLQLAAGAAGKGGGGAAGASLLQLAAGGLCILVCCRMWRPVDAWCLGCRCCRQRIMPAGL